MNLVHGTHPHHQKPITSPSGSPFFSPNIPGSWVPKRFSKQTSTADSGVEGTDHRLDVGGDHNGNDFDGGADDWRGPMRQVLQLGIRQKEIRDGEPWKTTGMGE